MKDLSGLTLRYPSNSPSKPIIGKVDGCINVATFNAKTLRRQLLDSTVSVRTCIVILYHGESLHYGCSILQTIP